MRKEKIISKFNMKNYSNQLEKVLIKKSFTSDTKNLLSDMLYKIENSYEDYKNVKVDVKTKSEILEEIIEIIENECKEIEIIKEKTSQSIKGAGKIITYLNTKKMLYEIYQIKKEQFKIDEKYDIIKKSLETALNQGYSINESEIIRDFDGWAWNIQIAEIEDITNNFLFQTLIMLVGNDFLNEWQKNSEEDYIIKLTEILENKYKTEKTEKILKTIFQISILNYTASHQEEKERLIELEKKLEKEFDETNDKKEYLKKISEDKKNINKKICSIDEIISNDRLLKEEFIIRNERLDSKERIFSLSDFVEILQKEKADLMKDLNQCNKKMEPLNFMKMKLEIENKLKILNELKLTENTDKIYNTKVKELINLVCSAFKVQIDNFVEKEEIVDIIYKIRYYKSIPVLKNRTVQDIMDFSKLENYVITIACKEKVLNIISRNIKENYEIIKNIFKTDIINLEKIYIRFIKQDNEILLEIFEEENKNTTIKFETIEDLNVSENRKIKLFV